VVQGFQFGAEVTPWFRGWQGKQDEHWYANSKRYVMCYSPFPNPPYLYVCET